MTTAVAEEIVDRDPPSLLPHNIIHLPKVTVSLRYFCFYLSLSAPLSLSGQCHDLPSARCGVEMKPTHTKLALAKAHASVGAAVFRIHTKHTKMMIKKNLCHSDKNGFPKTSACYVTEIVICLFARP